MPTDDLPEIQQDILNAYQDLEHPSFLFAEERRDQQWHAAVVQAILEQFAGEDVTTLDDEVCLSLRLRPHGTTKDRWLIRLSLVGPYAMLTRITDRVEDWIVSEDDADHDERALIHIIKTGGLKFVTTQTLQQPIQLHTPSLPLDEVTIYNALFTDFGTFPRIV